MFWYLWHRPFTIDAEHTFALPYLNGHPRYSQSFVPLKSTAIFVETCAIDEVVVTETVVSTEVASANWQYSWR